MIEQKEFGITKKGETVTEYIISNEKASLSLITYGGAVKNLLVKDKKGNFRDVVLGYDTIEGYESGNSFFGAFVGRYANRIKNSEFDVDGKKYRLNKNEGENHLHGTFARRVMNSRIEGDSVVMTLVSPPPEEGYPGTLFAEVRYTLTDAPALRIDYTATSTDTTPVNLTNHAYFNLNGHDGEGICDHILTLTADRYTPVDDALIPTGEIASVGGTPFDFREGVTLRNAIFSRHPETSRVSGVDHNLIFPENSSATEKRGELLSRDSGIRMEIFTTEPAIQLYTGNGIVNDKAPFGKCGIKYSNYSALCLEAQHYPASPNYPHFPSTLLKKDEVYRQTTEYRFFADE